MYFLLYEHDHENRAKTLTGHQPNCQLVTEDPKEVVGLTNLIFWGHGNSGFLCGLTPSQAADKVKAWRDVNKKIDTIEILTCNTRHATSGSDPFVAQFKIKLGFRLRRNLKVKALPIRMGKDGVQGDSILFADYKTKTWCYLTTPTETSLLFMRNVFKWICEKEHNDNAIQTAVYLTSPPPKQNPPMPATNPFPKYVKEIKEMHDSKAISGLSNQEIFMKALANHLKVDAFRTEFIATRKYSMNYGDFDSLRRQLVTIK